ncbi:MAG: hypothetical protein IT291_03185 [Deltaproteobacteria bacterium]|nr:hypothetical protein [Deltaproteobacteria bacterium]
MLLDAFYRMRYQLKTPVSVVDALSRIAPPSIVRRVAKSTPAGQLIERVSDLSGDESDRVLGKVGALLGYSVLARPSCPTQQAIDLSGYSANQLRCLGLLPQIDKSSYKLVFSDPSAIDRATYESQGIPLLLSTDMAIQAAWKEYDGLKLSSQMRVSEETLKAVFVEILSHAHREGAKEVFVGAPTRSNYEFIGRAGKHRGSIHLSIYLSLCELVQPSQPLVWALDDENIESIVAGVAQDVICLRWNVRALSMLGT